MWRSTESDNSPIAEECTAFLEGRSADLLLRRGRPRLCWSWLNVLAHAPRTELERVSSTLGQRTSGGAWAMANAFLAGEILDASERGPSLDCLRHDVLVPFELDLLSRTHSAIWNPGEYVTAVLGLIGDYHRTSRSRAGHAS